jgi:pimeloyl-ACP methyl ester carboxylesterase
VRELGYIRVRGFDCFVAEFGRGSRTIVLIHGWCSDSTDWCDQLPAFASVGRVITMDLRGHGHSERTASGYETLSLTDDVIAVMDALGVKDAHVVGHSLGGIIASLIAVQRPDLARSTLLIDPAYGEPPARADKIRSLVGDANSQDSAERAAAAADIAPGVDTTTTRARRYRRRLQALALGPHVVWETFAGMYVGDGAPGIQPASDVLVRSRLAPTCSLFAYEPTYHWERSLLAGSAHLAQQELWTGVTHFLHQDAPERFNQRALSWFDEIDSAKGLSCSRNR